MVRLNKKCRVCYKDYDINTAFCDIYLFDCCSRECSKVYSEITGAGVNYDRNAGNINKKGHNWTKAKDLIHTYRNKIRI